MLNKEDRDLAAGFGDGGLGPVVSETQDERDARRYRWLRNQLSIEDIEEMRRNYLGTHDESESVKCDAAVDAAMKEPQ